MNARRPLAGLTLPTLLTLATPAFAQTSTDVESRADALATLGDFADGAALLESLPDDASERTQRALHRAVTWRVALGDEVAAARVAGRLTGADGAMRALEVGALYEQRRAWRSSLRFHREWLARAAGVVSAEQTAVGRVALARAYRGLHDDASAMREYRAVAAMAPRRTASTTCVQPVTEAERAYADALAEATYRVVEHEARPLLAMRAPPRAPTHSDAEWLRYTGHGLRIWIQRVDALRSWLWSRVPFELRCSPRWGVRVQALSAAFELRVRSADRTVPDRPGFVRRPEMAAEVWNGLLCENGVTRESTFIGFTRLVLQSGIALAREHRVERRLLRWMEERRAEFEGPSTAPELLAEHFVVGRVRFPWPAPEQTDDFAPPEVSFFQPAPVPRASCAPRW